MPASPLTQPMHVCVHSTVPSWTTAYWTPVGMVVKVVCGTGEKLCLSALGPLLLTIDVLAGVLPPVAGARSGTEDPAPPSDGATGSEALTTLIAPLRKKTKSPNSWPELRMGLYCGSCSVRPATPI